MERCGSDCPAMKGGAATAGEGSAEARRGGRRPVMGGGLE